jgi:hypothetical protein
MISCNSIFIYDISTPGSISSRYWPFQCSRKSLYHRIIVMRATARHKYPAELAEKIGA